MFYLLWIGLFLYKDFYYSYLETTTSPVSALFYKLWEFLSSYYISEAMPDPGRSLEEKLAGSLLAQIQKEQIKKGWDDWTLLYSVACPLCQAAQSLWCYLCHSSHTLRLGCLTQKNMMHYQRPWMGFPFIFWKSGTLLLIHLICLKIECNSLSKYVIIVKASVMCLI